MGFEHVQSGERFTPPAAFEWNAMLDAGRQQLAGRVGVSAIPSGVLSPQTCVVRIVNKSGAARNRYEALTLGEPRWDPAAKDTLQSIVFKGEAPDPDGTPAVLLSPLGTDKVGFAVCMGPTLLRMDTFAGAAKVSAAPKANGLFDSVDTGPIRLIHAVSGAYGFGLVGVEGGTVAAAADVILVQTPTGGIPAATGSGPYVWGSASCAVLDDAGDLTGGFATVKNVVSEAVGQHVVAKAIKVGSIYVVDLASCEV